MKLFITHYNKVFWGLFLVAACIMFAGLFGSLPLLDILLALILIVIALHKVEEDMLHHKLENNRTEMDITMRRLNHMVGSSHIYTNDLRNAHESRIHNLGVKGAELDAKIEQKYREIARKIIEVENKLNKLSKSLRSRRKKL